jgi:hypothetical protein
MGINIYLCIDISKLKGMLFLNTPPCHKKAVAKLKDVQAYSQWGVTDDYLSLPYQQSIVFYYF